MPEVFDFQISNELAPYQVVERGSPYADSYNRDTETLTVKVSVLASVNFPINPACSTNHRLFFRLAEQTNC